MKKNSVRDWGLRLLVLALVVVLCELFVSYSQNFLLPRSTEMVTGLFRLLFAEPRFWEALYVSNQTLILGYVFSVIMNIPLKLLARRFHWIDRLLNPYV